MFSGIFSQTLTWWLVLLPALPLVGLGGGVEVTIVFRSLFTLDEVKSITQTELRIRVLLSHSYELVKYPQCVVLSNDCILIKSLDQLIFILH